MNRNYVNGRAFEYRVKRSYEKSGGWYVVRSAGSHGPADLVAIPMFGGLVVLIQCKSGKRGETKKKTMFLADLCAKNKCLQALLARPGKDRGTIVYEKIA